MKFFHFLVFMFASYSLSASGFVACGSHQLLSLNYLSTPTCVDRFPAPETTIQGCFDSRLENNSINNWVNSFPYPLYQPLALPWWAIQGGLYYPNVRYPGVWSYPGIQSQYYPGQGEIFAAKPNVYVRSIHLDKKFRFKFSASGDLSFLATTPVLEENHFWKGKIKDRDKFEVDGVFYDYLFYDIRLPKEKMQFDHGVCATREGAIEWMIKDLEEMRFSNIAIQDFKEHWQVKIPDYPIYCIYPQYNEQLDAALPVEIEMEQASFHRALYVLVPHLEEPDLDAPQSIPLPTKESGAYRPDSKITKENMFMEWGVAFIGL